MCDWSAGRLLHRSHTPVLDEECTCIGEKSRVREMTGITSSTRFGAGCTGRLPSWAPRSELPGRIESPHDQQTTQAQHCSSSTAPTLECDMFALSGTGVIPH
eukprot:TRINITY_DN8137_c0_g1_i1.p1 TRINITY_DN8137_c0_g1~~TRINITY_DN8137_c0_g1_i1.p1  ORF type:complete len:102 (-),score=5.34 TRINITY_DN8137_c0_g1_i1:316-621(-)